MPDKKFQLDDLVNALENEKRKESLGKLDEHFFSEMRDYLDELKGELKDQDMSTDRRVEMLRREYSKAKKMAQTLFHTRVRKISLSAVHRSSGAEKVETTNMLDREIEFFKDTSALISELKDEMFYGGYKRTPKGSERGEGSEKDEKETSTLADEMKGPKERLNEVTQDESEVVDEGIEEEIDEGIDEDAGESIDERDEPSGRNDEGTSERAGTPPDSSEEDVKRSEGPGSKDVSGEKRSSEAGSINNDIDEDEIPEVLVHVTEDVPPFIDIHTSYKLKKEDVVTLREDIAEVLIKRGKARKVELG